MDKPRKAGTAAAAGPRWLAELAEMVRSEGRLLSSVGRAGCLAG